MYQLQRPQNEANRTFCGPKSARTWSTFVFSDFWNIFACRVTLIGDCFSTAVKTRGTRLKRRFLGSIDIAELDLGTLRACNRVCAKVN